MKIGGAASSTKGAGAPDKETGAWQKHTKGIGLKYLQKFGFKGRLGKEEDGISAPVEAVVHGTGAGLGFGKKDKKEPAKRETSLKKAQEEDAFEGIGESEKIAKSRSWKKKAPKAAQPTPVVDMRFEATSKKRSEGAAPPLGQELLYNLDLACDMNQSSEELVNKQLQQKRAKLRYVNESISKVGVQVELSQEKLERLASALSVLQKIHDKIGEDANVATVSSIHKVVRSLYSAFAEEFKLFGLISLLQLTAPVMRELGSLWDPSTDQPALADIFLEWHDLVTFFHGKGEEALAGQVKAFQENHFVGNFLGSVRRFLGSANFKSPDACVSLIKGLEILLPRKVFEGILDSCVLPRLYAAINEWLPTRENKGETLASMVLPWRHLLGERLNPLLHDVRRKLMKCVETWQDDFLAIRAHLEPWTGVLDAEAFSALLLRGVLPRVILHFRDLKVGSDCAQALPTIFQLGRSMPEQHYRALIEGEFFPALVLGLAAQDSLEPAEALPLLEAAKSALSLEDSQTARYYYALALEVVDGGDAASIAKAVRRKKTTYFRIIERELA